MKKKILIIQVIHESGVKVFDDRFDVSVASDPSPATVIKEIKGAEGVICRMAPFTREIIEAADSLKVIGRHGVGVDTIDVYDPEPPLNDNPLYELDNIILSPHSAALTQECVIRMAVGAAEGVVDVLSGKRPRFVVNPEVLTK
jgi:phosphoglycerate dehydrogenase-like enzyme